MSDLQFDPKNARRHGEENKKLIRQSLQEVGPFRSIAVDGQNIVRAGNGVFEQARELGLKVRIIEAAPDELIAAILSGLAIYALGCVGALTDLLGLSLTCDRAGIILLARVIFMGAVANQATYDLSPRAHRA